MRRHFCTLLVGVTLLALPACESPLGLAFSGLLGAGAATGGQAALKAWDQKLMDRAEWRVKHREIVLDAVNAMQAQANDLLANNKHAEAVAAFEALVAFHNCQHPRLLIQGPVDRASCGTGAAGQVPEPGSPPLMEIAPPPQ